MITLIGTGNMARGISTRLVNGGHDLNVIGRNPDTTQALVDDLKRLRPEAKISTQTLDEGIHGEVVILAVPYEAGLELAQTNAQAFAGKIVVDMANALNSTFDALVTEPGSSAAEELVARLPESTKVVKAFNTIFAGTLEKGEVAGQTLDVFIAGNDDSANETVAQLVKDAGLTPVPVGTLVRARELEQLLFLGISVQQPLDLGFGSTWRLVAPA